MATYHVRFTCAADYNARRLPFRPAHLKQLAFLRERAKVVAGGPEPDGTAAHIFYRVADHAELVDLLEENEFNRAGLFAAHHARQFTNFVAPVDRPPLDAGLQATLVEGVPNDLTRARAALAELQERGRVAFGGFFADGAGLFVARSSRPDEAIDWLAASRAWERDRLTTRPWSQTL